MVEMQVILEVEVVRVEVMLMMVAEKSERKNTVEHTLPKKRNAKTCGLND